MLFEKLTLGGISSELAFTSNRVITFSKLLRGNLITAQSNPGACLQVRASARRYSRTAPSNVMTTKGGILQGEHLKLAEVRERESELNGSADGQSQAWNPHSTLY